MSLFNLKNRRGIAAAGLGLALAAAGISGCTVRPLYGDKVGQTGNALGFGEKDSLRAQLASIAIDAPKGHFDQIVRNRLIFLLSNGAGEPAAPRYQLTLNSGYMIKEAVQMNVGDGTEREGRASSGIVVAFANYQLKDGNQLVQARRRSVTSSFDRPRQEYANLEAEEDAKKRAAEELAQSIYLSLAQTMANKPSTPAGAGAPAPAAASANAGGSGAVAKAKR